MIQAKPTRIVLRKGGLERLVPHELVVHLGS